jgi:hypothetical protein
LPNFYNVTSSEDGLISTFTTRFHIEYTLTLSSYPMGEFRVFSLSLDTDSERPVIDYWIKHTVIKVISDFLKNDSNVILYICDSMDNREKKRFNAFHYWYDKAIEFHNYIGKYDNPVKSYGDYSIYSSLLYNKENPLSHLIIEEFKKQMELY